MAARKTAAQKAAEAAEREEYTSYEHDNEQTAPGHEESSDTDTNLTDVKDDKGKRLTVQQLKNKLRNEAEREVLDTHRGEVITITAAKYKLHNLEYVRRLTEEEKAQKQIEELYEKFPQLRPQQQQPQQEVFVEGYAPAEPGGALEQFRQANAAYDPELPAEEYADVVEPGQ